MLHTSTRIRIGKPLVALLGTGVLCTLIAIILVYRSIEIIGGTTESLNSPYKLASALHIPLPRGSRVVFAEAHSGGDAYVFAEVHCPYCSISKFIAQKPFNGDVDISNNELASVATLFPPVTTRKLSIGSVHSFFSLGGTINANEYWCLIDKDNPHFATVFIGEK